MKKAFRFFIILAAAVMVLPLFSAAAETGEKKALVITEDSFIYNRQEKTAFYYAKVENRGTEPLSIDDSKFVAFDRDGNVLFEYPYIPLIPMGVLIAPGDFAYVSGMMFDQGNDDWEAKMARYELEYTESPYGTPYNRTECEADFSMKTEHNRTWMYLDVTFSNDTDEIMKEPQAVYALYDKNHQLLMADCTYCQGLYFYPQSKIRQNAHIYSDVQDYLLEKGMIPETVVAYLYSTAGE